jgi:hypothetical protein
MQDAQPAAIPINAGTQLLEDMGTAPTDPTFYRCLVGKLLLQLILALTCAMWLASSANIWLVPRKRIWTLLSKLSSISKARSLMGYFTSKEAPSTYKAILMLHGGPIQTNFALRVLTPSLWLVELYLGVQSDKALSLYHLPKVSIKDSLSVHKKPFG